MVFVSSAHDGNGRYAKGLSAGRTSSFSWQSGELNTSYHGTDSLFNKQIKYLVEIALICTAEAFE